MSSNAKLPVSPRPLTNADPPLQMPPQMVALQKAGYKESSQSPRTQRRTQTNAGSPRANRVPETLAFPAPPTRKIPEPLAARRSAAPPPPPPKTSNAKWKRQSNRRSAFPRSQAQPQPAQLAE